MSNHKPNNIHFNIYIRWISFIIKLLRANFKFQALLIHYRSSPSRPSRQIHLSIRYQNILYGWLPSMSHILGNHPYRIFWYLIGQCICIDGLDGEDLQCLKSAWNLKLAIINLIIKFIHRMYMLKWILFGLWFDILSDWMPQRFYIYI